MKLFSRYKTASRTSKKNKGGHRHEAMGLALALAGGVALYSVLFPAGEWGRAIKGALAGTFGAGRALVPLWGVYLGLRLAWPKPFPFALLRVLCWLSFFFFFSVFSTLFGTMAFHANHGGAVGLAGQAFFLRLFGVPGSWAATLVGAALSVCGILKLTPMQAIHWTYERLKADIEEWEEARRTRISKHSPVVKPRALAPAPDLPELKPKVAIRTPTVEDKPAPVVSVPPKPPAAEPPKGKAERAPAQSSPASQAPKPGKEWRLPPLSLLSNPRGTDSPQSEDELVRKARLLEQTLANFDVQARTTDIHPGPVITRFDLEPAPGVKISSIVNLADDIALAMKAERVRVLAPIPGKGAVGIEIPNPTSVSVTLKEILSDARFRDAKAPLVVGLGKTSSGEPYVTDLTPMPHLLVAGATGTGKSVCIHTLIMSVLMRSTPDQVKFLLIDPKRLEMPAYEGLPHLYDPRVGPDSAAVITNPKEAAKALARMVQVMEYRYDLFAKYNVRNIEGFNEKRLKEGEATVPYIVVLIDELADLMLVAANDVEDCIQRLAQMARAVGIHLVLSTQRPSVDVLTGVIKANLPARIALRVASQIDSRVILDTIGAESLVGRGDMLFLPAGAASPTRLQGAFVSEEDVTTVVRYWKEQGGPSYEDIFAVLASSKAQEEDAETRQELDEGLRLVMERKRVSQDLLKAHFGSSARATNVLSLMEMKGFIHKPEGTNRWEIEFDRIQDYWRSTAESARAAAEAKKEKSQTDGK